MNKKVSERIRTEFRRFYWLAAGLLLFLLSIEVAAVLGLRWVMGDDSLQQWLPILVISGFVLLALGVITMMMVSSLGGRVQQTTDLIMEERMGHLVASHNRARSLQAMASTLRATLSFDRVVEAALDVCSLTFEEMGVPSRALVGAVFLYEHNELIPVSTRSFVPSDLDQRIAEAGIIGEALKNAEPTMTQNPREDPELGKLLTFQSCQVAVCIPLRAGFQLFGTMIIGSEVPVQFDDDQLEYFNSVADHTVIALQNAKLYQDLKAEKQRIIEADEDARKELARDLHDGPTQSVAAIAMRVNFIRSLVKRDPEQAIDELNKVERLARDTSREIRGMLFTLRPLVLETEGLAAAVETVISRLHDNHNLPVRFNGKEAATLLSIPAQSIVFSIVEEALGNARKYAEASQVDVRFWQEQELFVAQVQDNGVGFDVQSVNSNYSTRGSLGMVNMRERAERVDGSLRVESDPGSGTIITLVIPLDKHGASPDRRRRGSRRTRV